MDRTNSVVWAVLRQELDRAARPLAIVDVGGGTGGFAVPLARAGHRVTVVDASPDALAALTRRVAEDTGKVHSGGISAVQGDVDTLGDVVEPGSADLVLCHSVLEVVDDPATAVKAIAAALRPGGAASVVVANRAAAVLARAINGHLDAAHALLTSPTGSTGGTDRLRRRFDAASASALLASANLAVEQIHGVRVIADLVPGVTLDSEHEQVRAIETLAATLPPYRDVATQLHLLARL
ncbi:class I SAM-dependent methyltransferase [Virgisporangium aurantiacum]|uniref:Methyltransferase n=1 Tax=Virgisporangium aurantiacum TaxID=175570 RepID=A0A8J3ZHD0_9ACTN|nr:methyltransferase domain-containing protein [Virgisporangium aurantiacum]GIJ61581.1 methyltransferase [Virgisporangium aurantiacum]